MTPIRRGDGTGLAPKGFAEVRKGDGTVLWSAGGSAIPDSAVHRWLLDESGSTADDSIGSAALTHSGPTRVTDTWQGGAARDYDGVDDQTTGNEADISVNLAGDGGTEWSIGLTIEPENVGASPEEHIWHWVDGDAENAVSIGNDFIGSLDFGCRDSNGSNADQTSADISGESGKIRGLYGWDGSSATLYVNNIDESGSGNVNFNSGGNGVALGTITQASQHYAGVIDDVIIYDTAPTATLAQEDYNLQPWS